MNRNSEEGDTYRYDGTSYKCDENATFMPSEDTPQCFDKNLLIDIYGMFKESSKVTPSNFFVKNIFRKKIDPFLSNKYNLF